MDPYNKLIGIAICSRPRARMIDQNSVLEVVRLVTDGTKNACSFLYSACARIAKEMGYERIITYILETEPGTSLRAAGWICDKPKTRGGQWTHTDSNIPRRTDQPIEPKQRWTKVFIK